MSSQTPPRKNSIHPVLLGLNEQQINSLYSEQNIRKLDTRDTLFAEGDSADRSYLVIRGSLAICQTSDSQITELARVEMHEAISDSQYMKSGVRSASAIARSPVTVLAYSPDLDSGLEPDVLLILGRNMEKLLAANLEQARTDLQDSRRKSKVLTDKLAMLLQNHSGHYTNSSTMQKLLGSIPKLPHYASELPIKLMDGDYSFRELAEFAHHDPSLTSSTLKYVNSSFFGLTHKITDFHHASILLGFNQIYQIIINLGVQKTMPRNRQFKRLQNHSILISTLCYEISKISGTSRGAVISTIGLLHDIGKSLLLLLLTTNQKMAFYISLLDYARVGARLLEKWGIPETVYKSLEYQDFPNFVPPEFLPDDVRKNVATLYLAHLCHDYIDGGREKRLECTFLDDYLAELGLEPMPVSQFIDNHLLPSFSKNSAPAPKPVRDFLTKAKQNYQPAPHPSISNNQQIERLGSESPVSSPASL